MWGRARVLARRGLRRGLRSPDIALDDLLAATQQQHDQNVWAEVSAAGSLWARGGAARLAAAARLAPAPPLAAALVSLAPPSPPHSPVDTLAAEPRLQLRLVADLAPLQELHFWFDETTLALLDMPFLTLRNITGEGRYTCHVCGDSFECPNPLKVHLFLSCAPGRTQALWARVAARLGAAGAPAWPGAPAGHEWAGAARLEALAAAAGRGARGHACVFCGKLYSRRYGLKIHIRTHTGYKPLRCRHCLRPFGDPSNLNKHVRLHETARPAPTPAPAPAPAVACALCPRRLPRRRDLLRHLRTHHALDSTNS